MIEKHEALVSSNLLVHCGARMDESFRVFLCPYVELIVCCPNSSVVSCDRTYNLLQKSGTLSFFVSLSNIDRFFKILSLEFWAVNVQKVIIKGPTTSQTLCYTTS